MTHFGEMCIKLTPADRVKDDAAPGFGIQLGIRIEYCWQKNRPINVVLAPAGVRRSWYIPYAHASLTYCIAGCRSATACVVCHTSGGVKSYCRSYNAYGMSSGSRVTRQLS